MTDTQPVDGSLGRRNFFVRAILALQGVMGAPLAFIVGSTTLAPSFCTHLGCRTASDRQSKRIKV